MENQIPHKPSTLLSLLPVGALVVMLATAIYIFGGDALGGGSQIVKTAAAGANYVPDATTGEELKKEIESYAAFCQEVHDKFY